MNNNASQSFISVQTDELTDAKWKRLLSQGSGSKIVEKLCNSASMQFRDDRKDHVLVRPFVIDKELLAGAFEGEVDFEVALEPLTVALRELAKQKPLLDELFELVKAEAAK